MELINKWLANLVDKFKAKNPTVFALVQSALIAFQVLLNELMQAGVLDPEGWAPKALSYLGFALMVLIGSRTYEYKDKP